MQFLHFETFTFISLLALIISLYFISHISSFVICKIRLKVMLYLSFFDAFNLSLGAHVLGNYIGIGCWV